MTATLALILIGIGKAGFGGGVGLVAVPLMALTIPVADAVALMLPLLMIMDIFSIQHYYTLFNQRIIFTMIPGAVVGIMLGGLYFHQFSADERTMRMGIGILALAFVLFQASRALIFGRLTKSNPSPIIGVIMGGISGFTSTLAHAGGPPASIYILPQQLPRQGFVGTTVVFFFLVNWIKMIPYSYLGLFQVGDLLTILILCPICYLGVRLGIYLNGRVDEQWFNRIVYTLLFLTGLQLASGRNLHDLFTISL
ncbi:sulfite exporter TauE/SafE family protein [Chloroflexi bacterium TSY]|nr:sulfite exporter TauE/SafE family protein [Chloroflexi bacterium TSY]